MRRTSRPSRGTALKLVTALAGVAVAGWAIADTAGMARLLPSELPTSFVLAAAPGGADAPPLLAAPVMPDGPPARGAGPGAPGDGRPPRPAGPPAGPLAGPLAGPPALPGPARLAGLLAAAETYVGVRTDQIDSWRAFTDAALALVPEPPAGPLPERPTEPFARPSALAARLVSEGKKAEQLLAAIQQLKAKLTPAQLQRVAQFEALLPPPPPRAPDGPPGPH